MTAQNCGHCARKLIPDPIVCQLGGIIVCPECFGAYKTLSGVKR